MWRLFTHAEAFVKSLDISELTRFVKSDISELTRFVKSLEILNSKRLVTSKNIPGTTRYVKCP